MQLIQAKWIAPMDRPMLRDGAVLIDGEKIAAVDSVAALRKKYPSAEIIDLPRSVLLPGLVNAHTHLELSDCACGEPPTGGFAAWLVGMLQRTRIPDEQMREKVTHAISIGVQQCVRFGVTTVGDISRQVHLSRPLLQESPLNVVSFGEVMAMAQRRGLLEERIAAAIDRSCESAHLHTAISPHSPYSVEIGAYRRCVEIAKKNNLPLATHLAETSHEAEFLSHHTGPLRELWDAWLTWDDRVPTFAGGPIRFAKAVGMLDYPTLLAHVNYCDDAELDLLAQSQASVVYCPRTHAYFSHPPHRWREMLARGINVAVGTDSCASSPDLNLVDDLRLLRKLAPEVPAETIWQLATTRAARALTIGPSVGSITLGKFADLIAFEVDSNSPLEQLLLEEHFPRFVWMRGELQSPGALG